MCLHDAPGQDAIIPANFSSKAPAGKALCKEFVQQGLGLQVRRPPEE